MALASTRPIITFAEAALRRVASLGGGTPAAWWLAILTHRAAARLVHHRAGGDDHLRAAAGAAVLRSAAQHAPEVRDARPAVRQRVDRRHADPLRRAAGADGGAVLGLGHAVHARPLRLARRAGDSPSRRRSTSCSFRTELRGARARSRRVPDVERARRGRGASAAALLPVPAWITVVHVLFMAWTVFNAHYPALFIGGFLIFLGFARATAVYQSRRRPEGAAAGRLLPGRPGDPRRAAGLVDCAGAGQPAEEPLFFGATLLTAFNDNALITYLATLVPESRARTLKSRRRRRRGHRRRTDRDRQRAEPGRAVDPRPLLRRHRIADLPAGRRVAADAGVRRRVPTAVSADLRNPCAAPPMSGAATAIDYVTCSK